MKDLEKEVLEQSQLKDKDLEQVVGGNGDFGGESDEIPQGPQLCWKIKGRLVQGESDEIPQGSQPGTLEYWFIE